MPRVEAVLFDLDGTLVDSAPDLAGAANDLRALHGLPPLPYEQLASAGGRRRPRHAGRGLRGRPGDDRLRSCDRPFLACTNAGCCSSHEVFDAIGAVLDRMRAPVPLGHRHQQGLAPGRPAGHRSGLRRRAAVVVGGDSTPHTKPHPAPLLLQAQAARSAGRGMRVRGRRRRDMQAGRAAGMTTWPPPGATWARMPRSSLGRRCGAATPIELLNWLELA
jgi:phosphoglycolate phosphatase-like HAD superfamily hydrolase